MAEIENTENTEKSSKASPAMLRLPYAIAKNKGLSTDGMTPRQVWEMLKGKGISKEAEEKKFLDSQKTGIKDEPRDEPEQFFEDKKEPTPEEREKQDKLEWTIKSESIKLIQHEGKDALTASRYASNETIQFIRENKEEIISILKERERAANQREENIKNIEGLDSLEKLAGEWSRYNYDERKRYNEMMDSGDPIMRKNRYSKPTTPLSELNERYPRAAAYRLANEYEFASNHEKSRAGTRAKERIINGENPQQVLKEMEQEWSVAARKAVEND